MQQTPYLAAAFSALAAAKTLAVPCKAYLWLRRNLASTPFNEGYLLVFGFLIPLR